MRIEVTPAAGGLGGALRTYRELAADVQREAKRRAAGVTRSGRRRLKTARALRRLTKPRRARPW